MEDIYSNAYLSYTQTKLQEKSDLCNKFKDTLAQITLQKDSLERKLRKNEEENKHLQSQLEKVHSSMHHFGDPTPVTMQGVKPLVLYGENSGIPRDVLQTNVKYDVEEDGVEGYD